MGGRGGGNLAKKWAFCSIVIFFCPGSCGEGSWMWFLGSRMASVAFLHARNHPIVGAMAWQPSFKAV